VSSIWKNPKSKFWTACWRDSSGRQRRASTRTTDKRLARKAAEEFEKASRGKRTLAQIQKVLLALSQELGGEPERTLRVFCADFLAQKKPTVSVSSMRFYRTVISRLLNHLGERADRPISEVTERDLVGLRNKLAETVSAGTVNHSFIGIRTIFKAAQRAKLIAENPAEHIERVREFDDRHQTKRRAFTIAELQAVLNVADPEWRSMIVFATYTGARLGDISLLRWNNIDPQHGDLRFVAQKTGKTIIVPLAGPLLEHVTSIPSADNEHAFIHPRAAQTVTTRGGTAKLSLQFGHLLESAGLRTIDREDTKRRSNPLTFHSLRHTLISVMKTAGVSQSVVAAFVGHSSQQITDLYTHTDRSSKQQALNVLPRLQ
jgi:integrase